MERAAYSSTKDALTQNAFDLLLARLHPERERAGAEYATLREKLTRFFTLQADYAAEDAADETLDRMARKLSEGATPENVEYYAYKVARLILLEREKRERRTRAALDRQVSADYPDRHAEPAPEEAANYYQPMADCLSRLPEVDQRLLREYYSDTACARQRTSLAAQLGSSLVQLRLRVFRLRARLEECLKRKRRLLPATRRQEMMNDE